MNRQTLRKIKQAFLLISPVLIISACTAVYSDFAGLTGKTEYYVTFNSNGGKESYSSVKLIVPINNVAESSIPTVSRIYYNFNSWIIQARRQRANIHL
ncbi:MAG: hypothetical protein WCQ67_09520 [Treponema sp.]